MAPKQFDVFLSHNSEDKPAVERIATRLVEYQIEPWLDNWHLIPGTPWQEALEDALNHSAACAVFVGAGGVGPWQNEEMRVALDRRASARGGVFRVIPVLLPGAKRDKNSRLPAFLTRATWVEFHQSVEEDEGFRQLVSGIRGEAPGQIFEATEAKRARLASSRIYAVGAATALLVAIGMLLFCVSKAPNWYESGRVSRQSLYLLLAPWAMAGAAFVFAGLRSYAAFTRNHLRRAWLVGAPLALACLVAAGGFQLTPRGHLSGSVMPLPADWQNIRITIEDHKAEVGVDERGAFDIPIYGKDGEEVRLKVYRLQDRAHTLYDDFHKIPGPVNIPLHAPSP